MKHLLAFLAAEEKHDSFEPFEFTVDSITYIGSRVNGFPHIVPKK